MADRFRALLEGVQDFLANGLWGPIAMVLEALRNVGAWAMAGLVVLLLGGSFLLAWWLQRRIVKPLEANPHAAIALWKLELKISVLWPITLLGFLIAAGIRALRELYFARTKKGKVGPDQKKRAQAVARAEAEALARKPLVVATVGPTFLLAGMAAAVLYWLARAVEPVLHRHLGLSQGHSAWQFLLMGRRPELAWILPLNDYPYLALLLSLVFWLAIWWTLGNLLRGWVFHRDLSRNLMESRDDPRILPWWGPGFGALDLVRPRENYRRWASWFLAVASVLLMVAWLFLTGDSYRLEPSSLAIALVLGLAWGIHLLLRGRERSVEETQAPAAQPPPRNGWAEVLQELQARLELPAEPPESREPRPIAALEPIHRPGDDPVLSPLIFELLPGAMRLSDAASQQPGLTEMQVQVLRSLALSGYVHVEPPTSAEELVLRDRSPGKTEDRDGLTERNQIVLAPEDTGKTTLAMLAAANHALIHTRSTLIVTRSEPQAQQTYEQIRHAVEPSTMRWNLRVRRVGGDFVKDLTQNILPDVVVCSLHQLVTSLLDNTETFAPFLRTLGLVVIDDVESFAGGVEIHAQLAFRRLQLTLRQLTRVDYLGAANAPLVLVLGVDSMKETAAWIKSLCGIKATIRPFAHSVPRPAVEPKANGDGEGESDPGSLVELERIRSAPHHRFYRLDDFKTASGQNLTVADLVEVCEHLQVPWHYHPCGDGRRFLGRGPLLLEAEPGHHQNSAWEACVVFLEGRFSEVRREIQRLKRAGGGFQRGPNGPNGDNGPNANGSAIALITVLDPAEEQAFADLAEGHTLGHDLTSLPHPIIRPPSARTNRSHLTSDLLQHWIEVQDLVDTYEAPIAHTLRDLRRQGMLLTEERIDVKPEVKEYESKVYVRSLATQVAQDEPNGRNGRGQDSRLLTKVNQVEVVSETSVLVRNRADLNVLTRVEADSAGLIYYPGRIFESSRGRFVVVGRSSREGVGRRETLGEGSIEVEPYLFDDSSSPRRRFKIRDLTSRSKARGEDLPRSSVVDYALFPPEPVLMGRDPIEVGLVGVEAHMETIATYRLNPRTGEIRSKDLHSSEIRGRHQRRPLRTAALLLRPNPQRGPRDAPPMRLDEGRLLAALLRFLLPVLYRATWESVEVALNVEDVESNTLDAEPAPALSPSHLLGPRDGFYILDLHQGGNGTARALYRQGVELPLRFCRRVLEEVEDLGRLQRLYDHWGEIEEILADDDRRPADPNPAPDPTDQDRGLKETQTQTQAEAADEPQGTASLPDPDDVRRRLLTWLNSRLRREEGSSPEAPA